MDGENLKSLLLWMVGDRTHDPKNPWSVDDTISYGNGEVLVRLTTCKRLTKSLPKLSLITLCNLKCKIKVKIHTLAVRSKILSKLIFASCDIVRV